MANWRQNIKGFTLIEVLVVLTIMSIMLGLVTANFAMDERQSLQQEAHKLALLMRHASDTARTTGKPIAWQATKQGYIFLQLETDGQSWQSLQNDSNLRVRELPENMRLSTAHIAGLPANSNDMVIFSPSGLNPAFDLTLQSEHARLTITGDLLGKVVDFPAQEIKP
ncbi:MAG: type II secretion system minor pseudopilin GspH [Methylotenera sp.]|nr:type II secretion system minor pseudopilin GspH [Methylotenera sp.]